MSEIDWDKAPEGATHYLPENPARGHMWVKITGAFVYAALGGREFCGWEFWGANPSCIDEFKPVSRPSPAWSRDGLPPVGARCEAAIPHTSGPDNERSFIWIEGSVIAYYEIKGKTYAWFAEDDGFYPPNVLEFRPIRTPEQIAADEREVAIRLMMRAIHGAGSLSLIQAEKLYDAGYRKAEVNDAV